MNKPGVAGFHKKSDPQLHTILENLGGVAHQDDLYSGFTSRLDLESLERKAIYDRLGAIESQMKRRSSGGFARYLVGILIGVATILAWQSWTKPLAGPENTTARLSALETPQAATVAQTAPETVASKAPAALDSEQMQQLTRSLTTLQQTADQIAAAQDEMKRAIVKLASSVVDVFLKLPPPPQQPPAAPAHKPTPTAPPSSRTAISPRPTPHP